MVLQILFKSEEIVNISSEANQTIESSTRIINQSVKEFEEIRQTYWH